MNNATSPAIQNPQPFDLTASVRGIRSSVGELHDHPVLAWMTPQLRVRLLQADGGWALWQGDRKQDATEADIRAARFTAVEVPPDLALSRHMALPPLSEADLRAAVALEVRDANPFEPADLVWGHRSKADGAGQVEVTAVLASRRLIEQHIQAMATALADFSSLEVWVLADDGAPIVLTGFGEAARLRRAARGRWAAIGLLTVSVVLATANAVTPTVQLHLQALQATAAYQALQQRAAPAMAQREALVRGRDELADLREVMGEHIDPLVALDMLTQLIPDDTWLQRVQSQGTRFTVSGQTSNAAVLMNTLSGNPALKDVRAPAPATRVFGTNRESFSVEFTVLPKLLQRATPAVGSMPVAAVATPPAGASVGPASTVATAPAAASSSAAALALKPGPALAPSTAPSAQAPGVVPAVTVPARPQP